MLIGSILSLFIKLRDNKIKALESLDNVGNVRNHKTDNLPAAGDDSPLASFRYVLPLKNTQIDYVIRLGYFFDYLQVAASSSSSTIEDKAAKFLERALNDHKWAHDCLIRYINYLKNDTTRNLSGGSVNNYYAPIRLFYEANGINLNGKWISKGLPPASHIANDRAPTLEELRKLVEYPDRRIKVIVYVMASSGIRVDAWNYLKYKHITPLYSPQNDKVVIAAKLKIYDTKPDPYYTFCTPEAYQAIEEYMQFRASHGEKITPESWVLRDKFLTTADKGAGGSRSLATHPQKLSVSGVKQILSRALRAQNIRQRPLAEGERRYEFKSSHGFRKYYKSNAERIMHPLNIEILMDHKTGVSDSYYRPTEQELLDDYVRAIDYLSVNRDEKTAVQLQKQVAELTEKSEHRQAEKDREAEDIKKQLAELKANVNQLMNENIIYTLNDSLQGNSEEDVREQFFTRLEKKIEEAESKGEKLPVVVGKGDGVIYFTRDDLMQWKSTITKWRQQKQQEKKKKK
jgi:hypothetical protein